MKKEKLQAVVEVFRSRGVINNPNLAFARQEGANCIMIGIYVGYADETMAIFCGQLAQELGVQPVHRQGNWYGRMSMYDDELQRCEAQASRILAGQIDAAQELIRATRRIRTRRSR